ncbi:hypothetical protein DFH06DRAFT_1189725 [Mycena polygramma]|nr:hypothetical protein DFH06DRAFT_1189725 [Mycena polygramma]
MDYLPAELVSSNMPLTTVQRQHVQDLISERQRTAGDLATEYDDMLGALQKIAARRLQIDSEIIALKGIASPVRCIPAEILGEIFQWCIEVGRTSMGTYSTDNPHLPPMVLTHICSIWRDVAINTPRLWDQLSFYFPRTCPNRDVPLLGPLLHRSLPLCLTVQIFNEDLTDEITALPLELLTALMTQSQVITRLESLDISLRVENYEGLYELAPPTFPHLRALTLTFGPRRPYHRAFSGGEPCHSFTAAGQRI